MTRQQAAIVGGILMFILVMVCCALVVVLGWLLAHLAAILIGHLTLGWQLTIIVASIISFCVAFAFAIHVYEERS